MRTTLKDMIKERKFYNNKYHLFYILFLRTVNNTILFSGKKKIMNISCITDEKPYLKELRSLTKAQIIVTPTRSETEFEPRCV